MPYKDKKQRMKRWKERYHNENGFKEKHLEKRYSTPENYEKYKSYMRKFYLKKTKDKTVVIKLEKGGKCSMCGYDKEIKILHFHHIKPETKSFEMSELNRNIESLREEAKKCILLCPNCHAILHLEERGKPREKLFNS